MLPNSLDDIVFENRNKKYGAYYLRKRYVRNVLIGVSFTFFITISFSIYVISYEKHKSDSFEYNDDFLRAITYNNNELLLKEIDLKQIDEQLNKPKKVESSNIQNAEIVKATKPLAPKIKTNIETLKDTVKNKIESNTASNIWSGDSLIIIDNLPEYKGGVNAFRKYVQKQIPYPDSICLQKIKNPLIITFIISKKGNVETVLLNQCADSEWAKSVQTVFKASPKWAPATRNGKVVKIMCRIPVHFTR